MGKVVLLCPCSVINVQLILSGLAVGLTLVILALVVFFSEALLSENVVEKTHMQKTCMEAFHGFRFAKSDFN